MALDIIREQRMVRTLYYSLTEAAEIVLKTEGESENFVSKVEKFMRERILTDVEAKSTNEEVSEFIKTLGWRNPQIDFDRKLGHGKIYLGRNRFFIKEVAESEGVLLVIRAIFQGVGFHLFKAPVKADVGLSRSEGVFYEIEISRIAGPPPTGKAAVVVGETPMIDSLTLEELFNPIFGRNIPSAIIFEVLWKVVIEAFVANYSAPSDDRIQEALKKESMESLSLFILEISDSEKPEEITNVGELLGELFVKVLMTRISEPIINKLQSTLVDRQASSYLIYYERNRFCADKRYENRCKFIHGLWVGILGEIYGIPMKVKEVFHAGERDRYCMVELEPK